MLSEPFKSLKLDRYASQILQQFRRFALCQYRFETERDGTKILVISDDYKTMTFKAESWNSIAFELNKQMADVAKEYRKKNLKRWLDDGILQRANNN
ncbi:hypothetical protein [Macrococcus bovicus]|uniref:hypothetical protein n=1 Tax=Macrococcus bovicus TaxID=69968 RepID=UPI0025A68AE1|nr:hypothetical protein [Macrococcus bovicus]WJP97086.1 hypothetical protein QSV55_07315 [Macrococcus bovicus]